MKRNTPLLKHSENPSQEQILELSKSKGYTYQRSGKDPNQNKQVPSEMYRSGLNVDWETWINNIKMSVLVLEILKILSQRASYFRGLGIDQQEKFDTHPKNE